MFTTLTALGTKVDLVDPDASMLRDALPGAAYEPSIYALIGNALRQDKSVFFDIGALYGCFSVWAGRHAPTSQVVAFEANPHYADILGLNLRRNGCRNVEVAALAVSDGRRSSPFAGRTLSHDKARPRRPYARATLNALRRASAPDGHQTIAGLQAPRTPVKPWLAALIAEKLGAFDLGEDQTAINVQAMTLDQWVETSGIYPTMVKIDVHGAEVQVLRGMTSVLAGNLKEMVIEVHTSDLLTDGSHAELIAILEQARFRVYEVRGFRRGTGTLVPLVGTARDAFLDQRRWLPSELYFMKCLYCRK